MLLIVLSVSFREKRHSVHDPSARPKEPFFLTGKKGVARSRSVADSVSAEDIPVLADVPLGTSLRQQRKLYELKLKELFPSDLDLDADKDDNGKRFLSMMHHSTR